MNPDHKQNLNEPQTECCGDKVFNSVVIMKPIGGSLCVTEEKNMKNIEEKEKEKKEKKKQKKT